MHGLEVRKRRDRFRVDEGASKRSKEECDQTPDQGIARAGEEEECCGPSRLQVLEGTTDGAFGMFEVG